MSDTRNSSIFNITGVLLLLLLSGAGFFFWQKANAMEMESNRQAAELQGLELEKSMIERALDSLRVDYHDALVENEDLRGKEASSAALILQKEASIKKIKSRNRRDFQDMKNQVEALRKIIIEYETIITTLRSENEQLRAANQQLTGENTQLRGENTALSGQKENLAKQLEEQIRKTRSATFRATSFRVEVVRKHDKLTVRAKKARDIFVSFDLAEVPEVYRTAQKLYLVITDDRGRAIVSEMPVKTTIQAPAGPVAVVAQQVKQVSLSETQRLSFSYKLDERLASGNYVVAIYCETGLLGASSFRLT